MPHDIPDYDPFQSAYHEAFRPELYSLLDALPLPPGGHVIDLPCGNGFYTRRLAERLGPDQRLTAVDQCEAYLNDVREQVVALPGTVDVRRGDAYRLPFQDATFDLVWSAQSLISLDPNLAVREMYRICKPQGFVAILEVDQFHHVVLPWPAELEVALASATLKASIRKYGDGVKLSPARRLRPILRAAGFASIRRWNYPLERTAPFEHATHDFLERHFQSLRDFAYHELSQEMQSSFDRYTDSTSPVSLQRSADAELECMNVLYLASPTAPSGTA